MPQPPAPVPGAPTVLRRLRIGEAVALDVADVSLSARKGLVVVRSGKGGRCREIPLHPKLREQLAIYGSTTSAQHGRVPPPTPLHS